jgi:hypothetical protein
MQSTRAKSTSVQSTRAKSTSVEVWPVESCPIRKLGSALDSVSGGSWVPYSPGGGGDVGNTNQALA